MKAPSLRVDATPNRLPSLFGRYTAVFSDHEALHVVLEKLREMSRVGANSGELPPHLRPDLLLARLHEELTEHFAREESERYFGTLAAHSPALREAIEELREEHRSLLRATTGLIALAPHDERKRALSAATDGLLDWIERHERQETHIMNNFLSGEGTAEDDTVRPFKRAP